MGLEQRHCICACCGSATPATQRGSGSIILRPSWRRHEVRHEYACSIFCTRELDRLADPAATPTYESVNLWQRCELPVEDMTGWAPFVIPPLPPLRCAYCRMRTSKGWLHHIPRNTIACSQVCARNLDKRVNKLKRTPPEADPAWEPVIAW